MTVSPRADAERDPGRGSRKTGSATRLLWSAAGTFFLAVGLIGVAVPILPTTPFLLLAAACYLRSSKRMYGWMMANRIFGKYLVDYTEGRGMSLRAKAMTMALLWAAILITALFLTEELWLKVVLVLVALAVSAHVVTIRPRRRDGGSGPG